MGDADRRFGLVDVLAAGALRAHGVDLQVGILDLDIDLLRLRQHRDGRGRRMDAAGAFGVRHALHPMHAGFELQFCVGAAAFDLGDDFLEAADGAFARRNHLDLPALQRGEALIHAEQVAGEQRGLVAAGAGADFEHDAALVHRVLRQQRDADLLLQRHALLLERGPLDFRKLAHLGIGRRIGDQRIDVLDLGLRRAIGLHRVDDRR